LALICLHRWKPVCAYRDSRWASAGKWRKVR